MSAPQPEKSNHIYFTYHSKDNHCKQIRVIYDVSHKKTLQCVHDHKTGSEIKINKPTIAYSKPKNLRDLIWPSKLVETENITLLTSPNSGGDITIVSPYSLSHILVGAVYRPAIKHLSVDIRAPSEFHHMYYQAILLNSTKNNHTIRTTKPYYPKQTYTPHTSIYMTYILYIPYIFPCHSLPRHITPSQTEYTPFPIIRTLPTYIFHIHIQILLLITY